MSSFLYPTVLPGIGFGSPKKFAAFQSPKLFYLLRSNPSVVSLKCSSSSTTTSNQDSFVVSYLIENCGLSPESALSASKYVNFENPDKPDSVIAFLKNHGFSETQISTIIKKRPILFALSPEKILLPKFMFFYTKGASASYLTKLFTKYPSVFCISLEQRIIPSFNFLRNMLESDEDTLNVVMFFPRIFSYDLNAYIVTNINFLRSIGVPENMIVKGLRKIPKTLLFAPLKFQEKVEKAKEMGFKPEESQFLLALYVLSSLSQSTWDRKIDTFKKCGFSEEEILKIFSANPLAMATSEYKLRALLHFLLNEMKFQTLDIVKNPRMLGLSIEKRVVPRGLFVQELWSKGLLKKELDISAVFLISNELFLQKFVLCYGEKAPELLKLYNKKFKLAEGGKVNTNK